MIEKVKTRKVIVYVEDESYTKLRSKLILQGKSVSAWMRDLIRDYIKEE